MHTPRLLSVKAGPNYTLALEYATGEKRVFDATPYMSGSWFGELRNEGYFSAVRMLPDGDGITWPNGQDVAPHELYELSVSA